MGARVNITSRSAEPIHHTGRISPLVDVAEVAKALGATGVSREEASGGGPIGLFALRRELSIRLRSKGGRPALEGATKIQKIPLKPEDWSRLGKVSKFIAREEGISVTPGQVASALVHSQLDRIEAAMADARTAKIKPRNEVLVDVREAVTKAQATQPVLRRRGGDFTVREPAGPYRRRAASDTSTRRRSK